MLFLLMLQLLLGFGSPRDSEPLLRRSYPNEPTYQGYPEGGAARDPVPKAASAQHRKMDATV